MQTTKLDILHAVDELFDLETEFLAELVRYPSLRGKEAPAQVFVADVLAERGFEVDSWNLDVDEISAMPGFSPVPAAYDNAVNVVGILRSNTRRGRSLILNGHIDVVPQDRSKCGPTIPSLPPSTAGGCTVAASAT